MDQGVRLEEAKLELGLARRFEEPESGRQVTRDTLPMNESPGGSDEGDELKADQDLVSESGSTINLMGSWWRLFRFRGIQGVTMW